MRHLIYSAMVSLDGFIEGPTRELDWHLVDEELHTYINDQERAIDTHLYGRRTYEVMASFWPTEKASRSAMEQVAEYARLWKERSKVVFSRTLQRVEHNARLAREDVAREVANLKAAPGGDMALYGAGIASTFMRLGLIDEYVLYVNPVVLGGGTPMFPALRERLGLRLVETKPFRSGVVMVRYQRAHARAERLARAG
jgi:dihydrofolate reductase